MREQSTLSTLTRYRPGIRGGAIAITLSGLLFLAFPVVRPFSDSSPDPQVVASTFASTTWWVAHFLAMLGFTLLPLGLYGVHVSLQETSVERRARLGFVLSWIGAGLSLPFFGAEAFGLQVIGQQAVAQKSPNVLEVANMVRFGPAIGPFIIGLVLVTVGMVLVALAIWGSVILPRWSGVPLALGFLFYIPQLSVWAMVQPVRIADGLLIAVGSVWLGSSIWKLFATQTRPRS